LRFKSIVSFCLNSIVEQYNIIAKLHVFMSHPVPTANNELFSHTITVKYVKEYCIGCPKRTQ